MSSNWLIVCAVLAVAGPAAAQAPTVSGDFSVEPPTLVSAGFDWRIAGDDNRNAHVDVTFRRKGEQQWHQALPLLRLQHEQVNGRVGGPSFTDAKNAAANAAAIAAAAPSSSAAAPAPPGGRGGGPGEGGPFSFSPFSY